jgi:hypothetical protein
MSLDENIVAALRSAVAGLREVDALLDELETGSRFKNAVAELSDAVDEIPDHAGWREFIDAHPELTAPTRLEFTDDEVLDVLKELHTCKRRPTHVGNYWPEAWALTRLLRQRKGLDHLGYDHSHLMRVVAALRRLEKAGRVVQKPQFVYGQRRASEWHPAETAISTDESG